MSGRTRTRGAEQMVNEASSRPGREISRLHPEQYISLTLRSGFLTVLAYLARSMMTFTKDGPDCPVKRHDRFVLVHRSDHLDNNS